MATRDYVRRGQASGPVRKQNKRNQSKRKNKVTKEPTPWLRMGTAIAVIASFAYGLYWLESEKSIQYDQIVANSNPVITEEQAEPEKAKKQQKIPVMREEEWAFIDALPEYSVEVDVEELPESDKLYIMQCGSFRKISQAESLRAKIALQGLESEVIESNGSNGRWFRVVLGPYDRKRPAETDRHQLRRGNILRCKIW